MGNTVLQLPFICAWYHKIEELHNSGLSHLLAANPRQPGTCIFCFNKTFMLIYSYSAYSSAGATHISIRRGRIDLLSVGSLFKAYVSIGRLSRPKALAIPEQPERYGKSQ
jgi:hypothetical protein